MPGISEEIAAKYLAVLYNHIVANRKLLLRSQFVRGIVFFLFFAWIFVIPEVRSSRIIILLSGVLPAVLVFSVLWSGWIKAKNLYLMGEDLLLNGTCYDVILGKKVSSTEDSLTEFSLVLTSDLTVTTLSTYHEGDSIKIISSEKYPEVVLPVDFVMRQIVHPLFSFSEDTISMKFDHL